MRYLILALLLSGCSVATPLFETLVWNPNYCTLCDIQGRPQPVLYSPAPDPLTQLQAAQIESAIRNDQIQRDREQWQRQWATQPILPE
jgi:hypothetical protein